MNTQKKQATRTHPVVVNERHLGLDIRAGADEQQEDRDEAWEVKQRRLPEDNSAGKHSNTAVVEWTHTHTVS